jgi:hypothetical protein
MTSKPKTWRVYDRRFPRQTLFEGAYRTCQLFVKAQRWPRHGAPDPCWRFMLIG